MSKAWLTTIKQAGFSSVEALLAAAVFGLLATGLVGAFVYGRESSAGAGDQMRAQQLAEEGMEAVRNMALSSYALISTDGNYGLINTVGNQWSFSGTSDTSGIYTRQVVIASAGANRKSVTVNVTWNKLGGATSTNTVSLTQRLVNWPAAIKLWTNAIQANTAASNGDVTGTNNAIKVATQGNYAYVVLNVATTNNFVVADISGASPSNVTIKSTNSLSGTPTNIFVKGNYAYVTNSTNTTSLQIIDIANPSAPVLKSSVSLTGAVAALGVYVSGNYAYVVRASSNTAGANEFTVVDVSNPNSPSVVGGYNNNIQMNEVYVSGTKAYVATSNTSQEMLVIDITTPATPGLTATYNATSPNVAALTVSGYGNTVLLGMSTTLDFIDITTPSAPARLGTFTAAGTINDVDVDITNAFAFIGTTSTTGEFQVVNTGARTLAKTVDVTCSTSTVNGVSYDTALDLVAGATACNTQEVMVFSRG